MDKIQQNYCVNISDTVTNMRAELENDIDLSASLERPGLISRIFANWGQQSNVSLANSWRRTEISKYTFIPNVDYSKQLMTTNKRSLMPWLQTLISSQRRLS